MDLSASTPRVPCGHLAAISIPYVAVAVGLYWLQSAWVSMLAYHAGMAATLWIAGGWGNVRKLACGWNGKAFVFSAPLYLSAGALIYLLWPHVKLDDVVRVEALAAYGLGGGRFLGFVIYYCLVNPLLEELLWRGLLANKARGPVWVDVLFAGYHGLVMALFVTGVWALISVLLLTAVAWIWRTMARWWGGLAMPFWTHLVADAGVMAAVFLVLS